MALMWSWLCNYSRENHKLEILMAIVTSLVVAFAAVIWLTWNAKKKKSSKASAPPLPPGPRGLPLIGYLPFLGSDLHKSFTKLAGVYGPVYKLWLGNKLCVVVSSPSLANEVVRAKDIIFANRDPPIATLVSTYGGSDIVSASYGPDLRKLRKIMVSEMMSNASLDDCYSLRKREVKNAIRDVYNNKIGKPIDIGELSFSTSFNLIQSMLLGGGTLGLGEKATTELKNVLAELLVLMGTQNISDIFPVLSRFDLQGIERRTIKIFHRFDQIINSAIEQHSNIEVNKKRNMLQFLLQLTESEDKATSITMIQLKALLVNIITGGTETSANTVEWTMTELMQNPEEMKKVQEELAQVVGMENTVEESHLPKLRYLAAVLKETLRLHPALPELGPRCPSHTTTIGGYTIPKGTIVMLNVWAIHRDPQLWSNPMKFQPERFLEDPSKFDFSGNNFQYMPFSSGRRICPGVPLAERMLMFVLASLLHSFDWKLPCGEHLDFSDQFGFVMKKLKPLVAIPTPRLANAQLY